MKRFAALLCLLLITACTGTEPPAKNASTKGSNGQIILIRGLADVFSTGLDSLKNKLAAEGISARSVSLSSPASRARSLADAYKAGKSARPIILAGHSYGADQAIAIARELEKQNVPVALLITVDPTVQGPVTNNVRRAVNLHSNTSGMWGPIKAVPGYKGRLVNTDVRHGENAIEGTNHFNIEERSAVHVIMIREIKRALGRR